MARLDRICVRRLKSFMDYSNVAVELCASLEGDDVARFYASTAPSWWRYQLVSLGNRRLPPKRYDFYSILLDNGMFRYYREGNRPSLDTWFRRLTLFVGEVRRLRRPAEMIIILPDWLNDAEFTVEAARSAYARRLCVQHACYAVAHAGDGLNAYARTAEELASIDYIQGIAVPLKLNCSRLSPRAGRRVIRLECQAAVVQQVAEVARSHGVKLHGLGVALRPQHIKRLVELGLDSFDSSSWTRPNNSVVARAAPWSAKTKTEKERFFRIVLQRLAEAGVELEGLQEAKTVAAGGGRG